jgi:hypothetical protein
MSLHFHLSKTLLQSLFSHLFVKSLNSLFTHANVTFEQLSLKLQNLLLTLCHNFIDFQFKTINTCYIVSWIQMVVFIGNAEILDQLLEKICLRSLPAHPTYQKVLLVLKNLFFESCNSLFILIIATILHIRFEKTTIF